MIYIRLAASRAWISYAQEKAAECFAADCEKAHTYLKASSAARVGGAGGRHGSGLNLTAVAARRFRDASRSLGGLRDVALAVCCFGKSAPIWAEEQGRPKEEGLVALRMALRVLVTFYELGEDAA